MGHGPWVHRVQRRRRGDRRRAAPHAPGTGKPEGSFLPGSLGGLPDSGVVPVIGQLQALPHVHHIDGGKKWRSPDALWSEMDLEQAVWTVPGSRMKGGLEHRVPLPRTALDVLSRAREIHDGSELVFPSPRKRGEPLSDMTLTKLLRDTQLAHLTTVHGFRSTFRDWGTETEAASDRVLEHALAHRPGNETERAYARSDRLGLRRPVMEVWGSGTWRHSIDLTGSGLLGDIGRHTLGQMRNGHHG